MNDTATETPGQRIARRRAELEAVDAGTRIPTDEDLADATPQTMARWLADGRLAALGYGADKRQARR
jgi:hypothetical protein